jgi:type II secretory pathway pseudopilin PulG
MWTLPRAGRNSQAGITLIELLISMIILGVVTTMLIAGWINLQRASASAVRTNNARATARDAMSRVSSELRGAQPTTLPTAPPTPEPQPPLTMAAPMEARFSSSFNSSSANADGSGLTALRPTRLWLDTATVPSSPWNPNGRTLYWQRDMDGNGSFTDTGDRSIVLGRNVANDIVADAAHGTSYTPVFRYAYRDTDGDVLWTDNHDSNLDLASIVAVGVRLIIDKNMGGTPNYVDLTTTVRLRNASSD